MSGFPYKFRCRVYGKYDKEFSGVSPTGLDKEYSDLDDYDGLGYTVSKIADVNATRIGNPTISDDGVLSGLSSSNYLKLESPFDPSSNIWEAKLKVRTGNDVTSDNFILHSCKGIGDSNRFGIRIFVDETHFQFSMSVNGTSWGINTGGSYTVLTNTTYWIKVGWNGTQYYLKYSTDGITYTDDIVVSSTSGSCPLAYTYIGIFSGQGMNSPWQGSIDLKECSLKTGSQYFPDVWTTVWEGVTYQCTELDFSNTVLPWKWDYKKKLNTKKYALAAENTMVTCYGNTLNGTVTGIPQISSSRVVSGFSASNYISLSQASNFGNKTWETNFKIRTGSDITTNQAYVGTNQSGSGSFILIVQNSVFKIYLSSSTSSWDIASGVSGVSTLTANTDYWVKVSFDGSKYVLKSSTDGTNYTEEITVTSSATLPSFTMTIGCWGGAALFPFAGSVDLPQSYITVDGVEIWRGFDEHTLSGCINGSSDTGGNYYCYAISGDDHVQLVKKTGSVIDTRPTSPRYLGEVSLEYTIAQSDTIDFNTPV